MFGGGTSLHTSLKHDSSVNNVPPLIHYAGNPYAIDTVYRNINGFPVVVTMSVICEVTSVGGNAFSDFYVGTSDPPDVYLGTIGLRDSPVTKGVFMMTHVVPNLYYFRWVTVLNTGTLAREASSSVRSVA